MKTIYQDRGSKNILITGCSSGIGLSALLGLHRRGYRVIATARKHSDVEQLKRWGFCAHQLDLASTDSIDAALEIIKNQTQNRLYAVFNNGAYGQPGAVEDLPTQALREQFETNFFGWHHLTRGLIPLFRQQGFGRIIQNSSVLGYAAMKNRGAYNASKFALEGLSDTLRLELSGTGIHVILIEPGPIISRFRSNAMAKFTAHIDYQNSVHHLTYTKAVARMRHTTGPLPFTLPPESVVKALIHALESAKPKRRYQITVPAQILWYARRWLPTALFDALLLRAAN